MTSDQLVVLIVAEVVLCAVGLGLIVRGRWRLSWFFAAYVPAVLTCEVLVTVWPGRLYVPEFWMAKQVLYDVLKLGIALELAWRTFRVFPGAQSAARKGALAILVATTLATMAALTDGPGSDLYLLASGELHPRALNGTIWLMAATLGLAQWYHVPLHPFHVALLASFGAYLAVFGALLRLEGLYGWAAGPYLNALDPPAYLLLTCFWAYLAWRPESATAAAHAETLRKLQLRATPCG